MIEINTPAQFCPSCNRRMSSWIEGTIQLYTCMNMLCEDDIYWGLNDKEELVPEVYR